VRCWGLSAESRHGGKLRRNLGGSHFLWILDEYVLEGTFDLYAYILEERSDLVALTYDEIRTACLADGGVLDETTFPMDRYKDLTWDQPRLLPWPAHPDTWMSDEALSMVQEADPDWEEDTESGYFPSISLEAAERVAARLRGEGVSCRRDDALVSSAMPYIFG
jgi:hypothetical protein